MKTPHKAFTMLTNKNKNAAKNINKSIHKFNSKAERNLDMLCEAAIKLDNLCEEFVFVGGCTTSLLITDTVAPDARPTHDVDCIIDVISLNAFREIEKELRKKGFQQNMQEENLLICRWKNDNLVLDILPTDEKILGFTNKWYKQAAQNATKTKLSNNLAIKHVTAPYFLATKLEAFKNRGNNDYLGSHDLEDIITVIDGRQEIINEIATSNHTIKNYLITEFQALTKNQAFVNALPGHLNYSPIQQERAQFVLNRILEIAELT
ncbi:MAG: hypothetical protein PVG30_01460 [Gammaproteobacteria bacterium]|jgi:hypothetical protein